MATGDANPISSDHGFHYRFTGVDTVRIISRKHTDTSEVLVADVLHQDVESHNDYTHYRRTLFNSDLTVTVNVNQVKG